MQPQWEDEHMTPVVKTLIALAVVTAVGCSAPTSAGPQHEPGSAAPSASASSPEVETPVEADEAVEDTSDQAARARFEGSVSRIGQNLRETLIGRNWTPGCPIPIRDLRVVRVSYWNFRGIVREGPLVLHEDVAHDVLWVFRRLFRARFPIQEIRLAAKDRPLTPKDYWNTTRWSITASFNCRPATGSTSLSHHSYGWAIDINPLQNPYVRSDGTTLRHIARPFRDRSWHRKGMIHDGDIVVRSFAAIGWEWGGHWHTLKDYMHFSLTGR
jgi:hypothetical protein